MSLRIAMAVYLVLGPGPTADVRDPTGSDDPCPGVLAPSRVDVSTRAPEAPAESAPEPSRPATPGDWDVPPPPASSDPARTSDTPDASAESDAPDAPSEAERSVDFVDSVAATPASDATAPPDSTGDEFDDSTGDEFGDSADDDEPWPDDAEDADGGRDDLLPDYDPLRDSPQAIQARHWVRAGIVALSAGGVLAVGAVLMAASDPCNLPIGNSCQRDARNRAALVMGAPAAVFLGGGAAALAVGIRRRNALSLDLRAARGRFGVTVRGRF